jgi:catechol 2,3-dioxygenase-like lactoylglutathione lyase family enzyme
MNSTDAKTESATEASADGVIDSRLEVVVIPVSDVDRAKDFYTGLGWRLDADVSTDDRFRVVQLTPPGSPCSIIFGTGVSLAQPGSAQGLHLVVSDIQAARQGLAGHGVSVSEVFHDAGGVFHHAGTADRVSGPAPENHSYGSFASFEDPDGNGWLLQEITTRLPGRVDPARTSFASAGELSEALQRAAAAHGQHEARIGHADPRWPDWYAEYMVREQSGEELPS